MTEECAFTQDCLGPPFAKPDTPLVRDQVDGAKPDVVTAGLKAYSGVAEAYDDKHFYANTLLIEASNSGSKVLDKAFNSLACTIFKNSSN